MRLRVPSKHLLVFAIRGQEKFKGFYTPQKNSFADYYQGLCPVWIADMSPDCDCVKEGMGLGAKAYVQDVFDLDPISPKIVKAYGPKVSFQKEILETLDSTGGRIEANVIHESSIVGMEESSWRENPITSWEQLN